ncbi:MAG TPA: ATP-dependent DNA helicase [Stenotrophobium sp.]|jgi:ATP-dependent DNA helicase DinG|nr:ATP-dependent DNA helicase [Stenotrophobium sp.]
MRQGETAALLGAGGPLADSVPGFVPREPQQRMAEAVAQALDEGHSLAVEAGTGTGKTYAYLVPALMSGKRVVVSTGTKNLQDQLFHRDLPRVRDALRVPVRTALLKGRSNYLCLYRMKRAQGMPGLRFDPARLRAVEQWAQSTTTGELGEMGAYAGDDPLTPRITSTADNCLGAKCADFGECFVAKARRNAQAADLVVINHHLLFADFLLKEEGFGQILAGSDAIVVDEAHQLPELATGFFGSRVSTRQLQELAKDTRTEADKSGDMPDLEKAATELAQKASMLEAVFGGMQNRLTLDAFRTRPGAEEALTQTSAALEAFFDEISPYEERNAELAACVERAAKLQENLDLVLQPAQPQFVRWVEASGRGGSLHATPVNVAEGFRRMRATYPGAWIFTSATLAAGDDFSHFCDQLGLDDAATLGVESPFDFAQQARLYLPRGLPEPNDPAYADAVADAALPVIEASGGGAFVLCTSHRALQRISERLGARLRMPMFVQGQDSRDALLRSFSEHGDAVLVGTSSFWEGVDVKGRALRVVIIDRLPFAAPGDPVFEARLEAIRREGGNPFNDHQIPLAVMALRQGVGRLIRDAGDRGLLMLCDPRLRSKGYGRRMLASLPRMPQTDDLAAVQNWLRTL